MGERKVEQRELKAVICHLIFPSPPPRSSTGQLGEENLQNKKAVIIWIKQKKQNEMNYDVKTAIFYKQKRRDRCKSVEHDNKEKHREEIKIVYVYQSHFALPFCFRFQWYTAGWSSLSNVSSCFKANLLHYHFHYQRHRRFLAPRAPLPLEYLFSENTADKINKYSGLLAVKRLKIVSIRT